MRYLPQMESWFDEAEGQALLENMRNNGVGKPWVGELEKTLADFTGSSHAAMASNGTVTLMIGLLALGVKPGDEVLMPSTTMIACPNVCKLIGVTPVLVDIEPTTLCMDMTKAAAAVTPKTKALMYVPLNGRSGDMDEVVVFAKKHGLFLLEDAAQALGSYWKGSRWTKKHLGTFGDIGSFSFSLFKIITTTQGGALVTDNKELDHKIKLLKDFGRTAGPDTHNHLGWNFKLPNVLGLIGVEQFKKLPWRINRKKEIYKRYFDALLTIPEIEFIPTNLDYTTPWFIDIFVSEPDRLATYLESRGVGTRRFYPAINTQEIYKAENAGKSFPVSERYANRGLWLPSASQLTDEEIDYVTSAIRDFYSK